MEKELKEVLDKIIEVYNTCNDNDKKHQLASKLWTSYYKLSKESNIVLDEAYNLYLMLESESYIINQPPITKEVDNDKLTNSLNKLRQVIKDNKNSLISGISEDDVKTLLNWDIKNTRDDLKSLGINIENNSLNGFCELTQALSLMPLENEGLKTTINKAKDAFDYNLNHSFGTITFPVIKNNELKEETYLIDPTYRQFFTTVRCNEGRYYTKDENTELDASPDLGYFMKDISFAKELMANGYIKLDDKSAKTYGEAFYLSSLTKDEFATRKERNIDFYQNIINSSTKYEVEENDLEGLNISFPNIEKSKTK